MKKGFTLIELLATIAVLATVIIIAVPQILKAIENVKINAYKDNKLVMTKATENYLAWNRDLLPQNIGDTVEITLDDLTTAEYIPEISDNSGSCDGYILVTRTAGGYNYNPELKCGDSNTIGDSSGDGLILNYNFDEFAESTENEIDPKTDFYLYNEAKDDWSLERIDETTYKLSALVDNPSVAAWNNVGYPLDTHLVDPHVCVTYSAEIVERNTNEIYLASGGWGNMEDSDVLGDRVAETICHYVEWSHGFALRVTDPALISAGDYLIVKDIQIEEKLHATPFVDGIRNDFVSDKSTNNNIANLTLDSTPKWISEGRYEFDGVDDFISVSNAALDITNAITLSSWIKTDSIGNVEASDTIMARVEDAYPYAGFVLNIGREVIGKVYYWAGSWKGSNSFVNDNKWHNIVLTHGNTEAKIYIDGVLDSTHTVPVLTNADTNLLIGKERDGMTRYFEDEIDEVRVYNRVLSAEEIKMMYESKKDSF